MHTNTVVANSQARIGGQFNVDISTKHAATLTIAACHACVAVAKCTKVLPAKPWHKPTGVQLWSLFLPHMVSIAAMNLGCSDDCFQALLLMQETHEQMRLVLQS
jgi:hypothetical protein